MFVDEVDIEIHAGSGGDGCIAFLREKFKPKGGPAGGDGGRGGDVYVEIDPGLLTLQGFRGTRIFKATKGGNGEGNKRKGANGKDTTIRVPPGTVITDTETGEILVDMDETSRPVLIARGGKGGLGNAKFASSSNQAPRRATGGEKGQSRKLHLELKMIADIGIVGLPSAGKSSLVSRVSTADPKQAAYPFTTLSPMIGHIMIGEFYRLTIADLPGLIEDAHEGRGLGHQFLRHIQRTGALIHIIGWRDDFIQTISEFLSDYRIILDEMEEFDPSLLLKQRYTVLNKIDLVPDEINLAELVAKMERKINDKIYPISISTGTGVEALINEVVNAFLISREKIVDGLMVEFKLPEAHNR